MTRAARPVSLALMTASGFAGLGYQIVWTQQGALWLGHESAAVLAVVAAFFGGLALGALALGGRIERSARPLRWYAACEFVIGGWSLVLMLLMAPVNDALQRLTGVPAAPAWQWSVAFCGSFALLLPATAAMGATLPAMERLVAAAAGAPRSIAAHYAANTFGAVLGVLASAFWLVPALGLVRTAAVCCVLNLLCAGAALTWLPARPAAAPVLAPTPRARALLATLAATGLLGIGYEVLVVRVLSQVSEDTVYTFAMLLAVYLVGSALGAAAWERFGRAARDRERLGERLLALLALACLVGTASLWNADRLHAALAGDGMARAIAGEALLALAAFGLPTIAMGAVFSHLSAAANAAGIGFGRALGVNTLGAAAAPLLFGVLAVPAVGPGLALLAIALGYVALAFAARRRWRSPLLLVPALAAVAWAFAAPSLVLVDVPEGGRIVRYDEGALAAVSVVEDGDGVERLRIDNREQEGSNTSRLVDGRMALLPLLLHPAPRRALFLGLGTGVTAQSATLAPDLEVDAVELLPEVIAASALFTQSLAGTAPQRLHLLAADARRYVRSAGPAYDVIVSDNFHPARSGSGALYTVEHFRAVRARLAPGGVFCQWLPLHQLDLATTRSIVRSFLAAYPRGTALLASNSLETPVIGLVGRADDAPFDGARLHARLAGAAFAEPPAAYGLDDDYAVLGSFVAGPAALARFASSAPANTDDRPIVAYRAPRAAYAPPGAPRDRLIALLHDVAIAPGELIARGGGGGGGAFEDRLSAYWAARNHFIEIGRDVRPLASAGAMLAQVGEPLLSVLRTSPDFRPAYDPLLRMAVALGPSDAPGASAVLRQLAQVQPARPEAGRALDALAAAGS